MYSAGGGAVNKLVLFILPFTGYLIHNWSSLGVFFVTNPLEYHNIFKNKPGLRQPILVQHLHSPLGLKRDEFRGQKVKKKKIGY